MILLFSIFIVGLVLLWVGAELMIRNASRIAESLGVSPVVIGLTIVSLGTSAPELVVSIVAAIEQNSGISIGNIVGSNIANIGLILGIGAILYPMQIKKTWVQREVPFMIFATIVFIILSYLGYRLSAIDGLINLALMSMFLYYLAHSSAKEMSDFRKSNSESDRKESVGGRKIILFVLALVGAGILILGSELTVISGKNIAEHYGVSDLIIGLTLVAVGTSLPELATTIIGAIRKETDLIVGNIIGSNIFNLLLIGGIVPIVRSIEIDRALFTIQFPILLGLSIVILPMMRINLNLKKFEGIVLIAIYITFMYVTF